MTGVGDRVKELRVQAGLTQTALAGDDLSPSYVSLIEAGKRQPTQDALDRLAARLGTTAQFLANGDVGQAAAEARLRLSFALIALENGEADQALDQLSQVPVDHCDRDLEDQVRLATARVHERLGDLAASVAILEPLVVDAGEREAWTLVADAGTALVGDYVESGDLSRAVELGERLLSSFPRAMHGTDLHVRLGATVVWAYTERGDLLYAQHKAAELMAAADAAGSARARGSIYWNAALVAQQRADVFEALRLTERALALLSEQSDSRDVPRLRLHYAWLLVRGPQPDPRAALDQLDRADAELQAVGSAIDRAGSAVERGRALLLLGETVEAEGCALAALELLGPEPRLEATNALLLAGDVALALGRPEDADRSFGRAADMLALMQAGRAAASIWRELGDRFQSRGEPARAAAAYARALDDVGLGVTRSVTPVSAPANA